MEIIKRKNQIRYREKVYLDSGKAISKVFYKAKDAKTWKIQMESQKRLGTLASFNSERVLFSKFADSWINECKVSKLSTKSLAEYRSVIKVNLMPVLQNIFLDELTSGHADQIVNRLLQIGRNPKTINKVLMVLKGIVKYAFRIKLVQNNPLAEYGFLKERPNPITFLTKVEIHQLLMNCKDLESNSAILFALNTGMRIGEILGLCWDRVDFDQKLVTVSRTLSRAELRETTKTNLIRYVPMNSEVEILLKTLLQNQKCPRFVFAKKHNVPFNPDHFSGREFKKALQRAQIRNIRFHDLRHTYASQFVMNGGSIFDLQKILGHTDVKMTMKYAHLSKVHLSHIANVVCFSAEGEKSSSPYLAHKENKNLNLRLISEV